MLVLSLFPGIGLLDRAFEEEGFIVVRGPDLLWGGDVRGFHPPAGKFDGVIGGAPCQIHSQGRNLRAGVKCKSVNLIPEFERCVSEAGPDWFVMECTRRAPLPSVSGYEVKSYLVNNRDFGAIQNRLRRFTFGKKGVGPAFWPITPAALQHPKISRCITASDGKRNGRGCNLPDRLYTISAQQILFPDACELQGLPRNFLEDAPFTKEGKYRVVGNGVPLIMGRAIARAVKEALAHA